MPGAAQRYVAKLAEVAPDAAILDLEDGIAGSDVAAARGRVAAVLAAGSDNFLPPVVAVRSHPVSSAEFAADVAALGPRLTVLMLPKVAGAAEVVTAVAELQRSGLSHVAIVVMIESAVGLENLAAILAAHSAVVGVAFGAEDFAADIGLPPPAVSQSGSSEASRAAAEGGRLAVLDAVRTRLVTAAAAAGVAWRIDTPVLQIRPVSAVEN
ncbi:MAG TPA: aldolase/citrate lyase family protein, partial [Trueperaceae bacterium]|nr:aldolase/citrate lyase family protein [Trueperaceae bacterium]